MATSNVDFKLTFTSNVSPVFGMTRATPNMKVHLMIQTGEVYGFPVKSVACNVREHPSWFQKNYPLRTSDPTEVTCKNCLRRM